MWQHDLIAHLRSHNQQLQPLQHMCVCWKKTSSAAFINSLRPACSMNTMLRGRAFVPPRIRRCIITPQISMALDTKVISKLCVKERLILRPAYGRKQTQYHFIVFYNLGCQYETWIWSFSYPLLFCVRYNLVLVSIKYCEYITAAWSNWLISLAGRQSSSTTR